MGEITQEVNPTGFDQDRKWELREERHAKDRECSSFPSTANHITWSPKMS